MRVTDQIKMLFDQQWGTGVYQEDYPTLVAASTVGNLLN
jgi:hypothetical protein